MPALVLRMLKLSRTTCRKCDVELSSVVEFRRHSQKLALYAFYDRTSPWKAIPLSAFIGQCPIGYRLARRCKAPVRLAVIRDYSAGTLSVFVAGDVAQGGAAV